MNVIIKNISISFLMVFLIIVSQDAYSQKIKNFGIQLTFIKKYTNQSVSEIASNVVKIANYTNTTQDVILSISVPDEGWSVIGESDRGYRLYPGDSMYIPVRISPNKQSKGNTNYVANAVLTSNNVQIAFDMWHINIDKVASWHALIPEKKVYFSHNSDTSHIQIIVQNTGNSDENLILTLRPDPNLIILDSSGTTVAQLRKTFKLTADMSSTFYFMIVHRKEIEYPTDVESENGNKNKKYSIRVSVKNENLNQKGSKSWNGTIDIFKLQDELRINKNGYNSIPLAIEFNTYDLLTKNSYSTLDLYGHTMLPKNRIITYYIQSPFNSNYFNATSYLGRYHYFGYESEKLSFGIGNISFGKTNSNLSGIGTRASYIIGNHKVGGIFIRSPHFFNDYFMSGYGAEYSYTIKTFSIENYYIRKNNIYSKVNSDIANTFMSFRLNLYHTIHLGFGLSNEYHYWDQANSFHLPGYHYRFFYNGQINKLRLNFVSYYGSKNYSELRGIFSLAFNSVFQINPKNNISFGMTHLETDPENYRNGVLISGDFYTRKNLLSLRYIFNHKNYNFIVNPYLEYYDYLSLRTLTKCLGIDFKSRGVMNTKFNASAIGGYVKALDHSIADFFIANLRTSFRYKSISTNIRYYYGPFFTREQIDFIENQINPQRIYISAYHDKWFANNKFLLTTNINYNYGTLYRRGMFTIRPELFYYPEKSFRISAYIRYALFTENPEELVINEFDENIGEKDITSKFEVGFGLKKDIGLPLSFRKFNDLKVIVFKDLNGNNQQDKNEPGIQDMLVIIQYIDTTNLDLLEEMAIDYTKEKLELITNSDGKAIFNNIAKGEYLIQTIPLSSQGGWFDGRKITVSLNKDKTVYVPLSKGSKVSGGIIVDRERFSQFNEHLNLANIRVTAIDSVGKNYSTLTDNTGSFSIFLPSGQYIINVNEAALGDRFEVLKNNLPVLLNSEVENYNMSFFVVEKRRKITVKKFDTKGNILSTESDDQNNSDFQKKTPENINNTQPDNNNNSYNQQNNPQEKSSEQQDDFGSETHLNVAPDSKKQNKSLSDKNIKSIDDKVQNIDMKVENIEKMVEEIKEEIEKLGGNTNAFKTTNPSSNNNSDNKPVIIKKNIVEIPKELMGTIEDYEFYIIVGAFKVTNNALNAYDYFKHRKGFNTIIIHNEVRDWYYVCLENFFSYTEATRKHLELKRKGIDNWIYFVEQENNLNKYKGNKK